MNPNEAAEQVDVLIAGAGPTGLSTALALAPLPSAAFLPWQARAPPTFS